MAVRPLAGRRIVVTRAGAQAGDLVARLLALGAEPIECPAISIAPLLDFTQLDKAIGNLKSYDWVIFTSVNGVAAFTARMRMLGVSPEELCAAMLAAIGPATREALIALGCAVDFMPGSYVAEAIVEQINGVDRCRILLPRADIARRMLADGLREKGATVDEVDAYRTLGGDSSNSLAALLQAGSADAVTFTSSSTVRYSFDALSQSGLQAYESAALLNRTAVVCIGPITAQTARELGIRVAAVAEQYTTDGLVQALLQLFTRKSEGVSNA